MHVPPNCNWHLVGTVINDPLLSSIYFSLVENEMSENEMWCRYLNLIFVHVQAFLLFKNGNGCNKYVEICLKIYWLCKTSSPWNKMLKIATTNNSVNEVSLLVHFTKKCTTENKYQTATRGKYIIATLLENLKKYFQINCFI